MERINFDSLTPLKFKRNVFEFLKGKIMNLNPSAELNWEDFKMTITRPVNIDSEGTVVLSLKDEVKTNYVNPHRTVTFKYTTDVSLADILRDQYNIPEVVHYDDIPELVERISNGSGKYPDDGLLPGSDSYINKAYKRDDGKSTSDSNHPETYEALPEDLNARYVIINHGTGISDIYSSTSTSILCLLPLARTTVPHLEILGNKESIATKDFNIEGGEFTVNTLGITLSEITEG